MSWLEEREEKGCRWRKPLSFYILSSAQARPIFSPAAPVPLGTRRHRIERGPGRTPPPPPPLLCAWDEIFASGTWNETSPPLCSLHRGQIALLLRGGEVCGWDPHRLEGICLLGASAFGKGGRGLEEVSSLAGSRTACWNAGCCYMGTEGP